MEKGRREVVEIRCFEGTFDRFLTIWFRNYGFLEVIPVFVSKGELFEVILEFNSLRKIN